MGAVGAGVTNDTHLLRNQSAVLVDTRFISDGLRVTGTARHKLLGPGQFQPDRLAGGNG